MSACVNGREPASTACFASHVLPTTTLRLGARSMATTAFTDIYLRKLKPPAEGRIEVYDGKIAGFGLRVSSAGTKTFFVLGRHGRSFKRISLGRYPTLTLEKARRKAIDALRDLADGVDPSIELRAARGEAPDQFPRAVDGFVELHCLQQNRASTAHETQRLLVRVFVPRWQARRVGDIGKSDVQAVMDELMAAGTPSAARHAFPRQRRHRCGHSVLPCAPRR